MADIASTDVTYTQVAGSAKASPGDPRFSAIYTIAFGDGVLTYPSGGVPLLKGKLGCPSQIDELIVIDSGGSALDIQYNVTTGKIRLFNSTGAHSHDLKIIGGQAAASTAATAYYATDIFGKEAATNTTIAGSASATKGGVMEAAASAGAELGNVAVAATTLKVKVVGW